MTLVGLDLCMILIFVAVQGLRDNLAVHLVPNGEEPITLMGVSLIILEIPSDYVAVSLVYNIAD